MRSKFSYYHYNIVATYKKFGFTERSRFGWDIFLYLFQCDNINLQNNEQGIGRQIWINLLLPSLFKFDYHPKKYLNKKERRSRIWMRSKLLYYLFKVRLIITQKILNEKRRRKVEFGCHPNYLIISSKLGWLPPKKFRKKREEGEAEFGWDPNYLIISST